MTAVVGQVSLISCHNGLLEKCQLLKRISNNLGPRTQGKDDDANSDTQKDPAQRARILPPESLSHFICSSLELLGGPTELVGFDIDVIDVALTLFCPLNILPHDVHSIVDLLSSAPLALTFRSFVDGID